MSGGGENGQKPKERQGLASGLEQGLPRWRVLGWQKPKGLGQLRDGGRGQKPKYCPCGGYFMNIRDPVHGQIEFCGIEKEVVDLADFQRLRQIKQVGMTYLVYPGAHHTRFEHSLGTAHISSLMAQKLGLSQDEAAQVRLAALLHDVGHMPFSHDSEEVLFPFIGNHEQIGKKKIEKGEIADALSKNYSPKKISELAFGGGHGQIICSDVGADR
ncbi:MAG: HD domain-containing protein, partial [Candidatus Micrarchaeota archaeon]